MVTDAGGITWTPTMDMPRRSATSALTRNAARERAESSIAQTMVGAMCSPSARCQCRHRGSTERRRATMRSAVHLAQGRHPRRDSAGNGHPRRSRLRRARQARDDRSRDPLPAGTMGGTAGLLPASRPPGHERDPADARSSPRAAFPRTQPWRRACQEDRPAPPGRAPHPKRRQSWPGTARSTDAARILGAPRTASFGPWVTRRPPPRDRGVARTRDPTARYGRDNASTGLRGQALGARC